MCFQYSKILIVGCGGAGKSTLARKVSAKTALPVVHLDKLWWLPGWTTRSEEEFDMLLAEELKKPRWIMDGNFVRTLGERLKYADLCIFLDYDLQLCLQSVYDRIEEFCGRTRPDMTEGCPERADGEFEQWILNYPRETRPRMIEEIEKSGIPCLTFSAREEAERWLADIEA